MTLYYVDVLWILLSSWRMWRRGEGGVTGGQGCSTHTRGLKHWHIYPAWWGQPVGSELLKTFSAFEIDKSIYKMISLKWLRSTSLSLHGDWFRVIKCSSRWDRKWKSTRINWVHIFIRKRKQTPLERRTHSLEEETINSFSVFFPKRHFMA